MKDELQKKKEEEKQQKINELMNELSENENIVITGSGCIKILSSGINKNKPCGAKIINNEKCLCKRHM